MGNLRFETQNIAEKNTGDCRRNRLRLLILFSLLQSLIDSPQTVFSEEIAAQTQPVQKIQEQESLHSFLSRLPQNQNTSNSAELFNQAVEEFKKGRMIAARRKLRESIKFQPTPLAYELLGDLDYQEQQLKEAQANFEKAYELWPHESLQKKIEKLKKETPVEEKMTAVPSGNFIVYYNKKQLALEQYPLREMLREAYRHVSQELSSYLSNPVPVLLYEEEEFQKTLDTAHWVRGLYDGKIRMPVNPGNFSAQRLKALTYHELTHAFIANRSSNQAPAWLQEGLAEYEENQVQPVNLGFLQNAIRTNSLLPLEKLMSQDSVTTLDEQQAILFYQQSYHVVNYLIRRFRMYTLKVMLEEFGKGKNSEEVVQQVLYRSLPELEKEWKRSFNST